MPAVTNIAAYRFAPLDELPALRERLTALCRSWNLRGTILLSPEGINLFVAGGSDAIERLLAEIRSVPGLTDLTPKVSTSDEQPFTRMLVKIKKEIIAFGVEGIDPARHPAPRLSPQELKRWLDEGRAVTLLDTRNDFEVKLGTFRQALAIGIEHFRDFPEGVRRLPEAMKQQPVVTFCTGGIRCEKAGPYLQREGFENVFQLDGGILKYFEECGGEHFDGECFVFDKRVGLEANLEESPRTLCFVCQTALSGEEQLDPRFVESVSCPYCFVSIDHRRALELAVHRAALRRVTAPLPGSVPFDNRRPLKVPGQFAGSTLLEFLIGILGTVAVDWPRECERGNLLDDDGGPAAGDRIVREGERYEHRQAATVEPDVNAEILLLHEDDALIIVDKPSPLLTGPSGPYQRNTLQSILREVYAPQKPRPAHRLDADTTGLVVFTRTAAFAQQVQSQFERGDAEAVFLARVHGDPPDGLNSVRVLQRSADGTSLLEVQSRLSNPIPIDLGPAGHPPLNWHLWKLTLTHPISGERVSYESDLPEWSRDFPAE